MLFWNKHIHRLSTCIATLIVVAVMVLAPLQAQAGEFEDLKALIESGEQAEVTISPAEALCLEDTITIPAGVTVVIDAGDQTLTSTTGSGPAFVVHGTLVLSSGTLTASGRTTGCVIRVCEGGAFDMEGGCITGVSASGNTSSVVRVEEGGSAEVSGGTITGNSGMGRGCIWVQCGAEATVSGGSISGNRGNNGTALYVGSVTSDLSLPEARLTMTGGELSNNAASAFGGALYLQYNSSTVISGGLLEGNSAGFDGGAIYVNGVNSGSLNDSYVYLYLGDTVIYDNTASRWGGGIWNCQNGSCRIYEGVSVFNNAAGQAGDDIVNVSSGLQERGFVLDTALLGGGTAVYYHDGGVRYEEGTTGDIDPDVPRYDPDDPGEQVVMVAGACQESFAAKAVASEGDKQAAIAATSVIMRGNSSPTGGAIANNGSVLTLGKDDGWSMTIAKAWDGVDEDERASVTVALMYGDYLRETVTIGVDDDWTAAIHDLPDPNELRDMPVSIVEGEWVEADDGSREFVETTRWVVTYDELARDEATHVISARVTNGVPRCEVVVGKVWDDGNDADGIRPDSVTVRLLADGVETGDVLTLTAEGGWKGVFSGLRVQAGDGSAIAYTVEEDVPPGYEASVSGNAESGFSITNTHVPVPVPEPEPQGLSTPTSPGRPRGAICAAGHSEHR